MRRLSAVPTARNAGRSSVYSVFYISGVVVVGLVILSLLGVT
jgi:hypothetical protein